MPTAKTKTNSSKPAANKARNRAKTSSKKVAVPPPEVAEQVAEPPSEAGWKSRTRKLVQCAGRFVLRSSIPEVLFIVSLIISRYLLNSGLAYPSELILPIVLLALPASLLFYLYKWILKSPLAAHAAALPLAYGLYAYSYAFTWLRPLVDVILPGSATPFTTAVVTILIWMIVFGLVALALDRLVKRFTWLRELPLLKIAIFAICFIFVVQIGKFTQRVWTIRHQLGYSYSAPDLPHKNAAPTSKPNIYYLVLDRYASNETLSRQYQYDNSGMTNFLASQGFVTRPNAYANYPFTMHSVSSTLAMEYHLELGQFRDDAPGFQTSFPYRQILNNSPVTQELHKQGYAYNHMSSWWEVTRNITSADTEPTKSFRLRIFGKQFWLSDLQREIVNKSILSPALLKGLAFGSDAVITYDKDHNPRQNFEGQLTAVKAVAEGSAAQQKPQFTFAHILSPHDPYIFSETGDTPSYNEWRNDEGVDEAVKYTNQLAYVNSRFQDLIRTIREKDKNAIVIIQADEGPYPKQFRDDPSDHKQYFDPVNLPLAEMQQKFGILASYYMPNMPTETVQKEIDSSVNAFRFVLNHYMGYGLKQLPDCHFTAGNKYYMYKYELVSGTLTGLENPAACKEYE